ncbi:MAG: galactokinase [Cyclobacteriaceae bacterium]|nr:galactokinase [Cyclobacteriaceae bacterium]
MTPLQSVDAVFKGKFNNEPFLIVAPGRINLMGEHTDYNNGFVMPAAVDKHIAFAAAPNGTDQFNVYSLDFNESFSFHLSQLKPGNHWSNYMMGVAGGFKQQGLPLAGIDCVFGGNIPTGAGLSSSAALCCGIGFVFNELFHFNLTRLQLAKIAQRAEHEFAGVRCGIMDQYASLFGLANAALMLDCRSLQHEYLPIRFQEVEILLIDTNVKHELASSAYNQRRAACEEGVSMIQKNKPTVQSLRDADLNDLEMIQPLVSPDVFSKCQFIIQEIARTQQAAQLLKAHDLAGFGKKMFETHWGLSKKYEVSCSESDFLVKLAENFGSEVVGARQMGGGFGGCTINLVNKAAVQKYTSKVKAEYVASFKKEPDFYSVMLMQGVHAESITP